MKDTEHEHFCDDEIVEFDVPTEFGPLPRPVSAPVDEVVDEVAEELAGPAIEVRRRVGLVATVGLAAAGVSAAYVVRALHDGGVGTWAVAALMGVVALAYVAALVDARAPLLVADAHGVRLRFGRSWTGLTWGSLRAAEVAPRSGLRDGRLVLVPRNAERVTDELDPAGRRSLWLGRRLYGAPFAVPLSLATRVTGVTGDLVAALQSLAAERTQIVHVVGALQDEGPDEVPAEVPAEVPDEVPETAVDDELDGEAASSTGPLAGEGAQWHDPRPALAHGISRIAARLRGRADVDADGVGDLPLPTRVVASATPSPLRAPVPGRRTEVSRELVMGANALKTDPDETDARRGLPEAFVLRRPGSLDLDLDLTGDGFGAPALGGFEHVRPIAVPGEALETIVIEDFAIDPAEDPVIGPEVAAARTRLGLSVDQLAERTRIRPHVIESIEADDFEPCGGDFYARGHIRTLARILGIDAAPLLTSYDERYADAPVNPRRVFEAELAHSGGIRATRGGPNWSVLVAAVMALVLAWSIARLVMDSPVSLHGQPVLNGSGGPNHKGVPAAAAVPVVISAPSSGARVIVRDGSGSVVYTGDLAFGATKALSVSPPVRVQATDGSVTVSVGGEDRGPLGKAGTPGSGTYVVR